MRGHLRLCRADRHRQSGAFRAIRIAAADGTSVSVAEGIAAGERSRSPASTLDQGSRIQPVAPRGK